MAPGHIRYIISVAAFAVTMATCTGSIAGPTAWLQVDASSDTDALVKAFNDIDRKVLTPCVTAAGRNNPAVRQQCICGHRKQLQPRVKAVEEILTRHPTWRDKMLSIYRNKVRRDLLVNQITDLEVAMTRCH
ncbi:MAG TPA: hypothetical protein VKA76_11800 [Gammaproteobacteria bacterium]|nr:hypothetical protein [Gammaproteobacteria bacterium]